MLISILASGSQKMELLKREVQQVHWANNFDELLASSANVYIDLMFQPSSERVNVLKSLLPQIVIIHSVTDTLARYSLPFIRINAWPGFLERMVFECALPQGIATASLQQISHMLNREMAVVADQPGLISARVIAMIINEAYLALEDGTSSKEGIDLAMKTGTNYPFGPFEWTAKIGAQNILALLERLAETDARYQPASLLRSEAEAQIKSNL